MMNFYDFKKTLRWHVKKSVFLLYYNRYILYHKEIYSFLHVEIIISNFQFFTFCSIVVIIIVLVGGEVCANPTPYLFPLSDISIRFDPEGSSSVV